MTEVPPSGKDATVDRRQALRAALGGAAAAAVFAAPRVEGFSLAPDYASAASCISGTATINHNTNGANILGGGCLGTGNTGNCTTWNSTPTTVTTGGVPLVATVSLSGTINNGYGGGNLTVNVNGITNNTNQTCNVTAISECGPWDNGTYAMSPVGPSPSNLSYSGSRGCNARVANMAISVTVACTCS